MNGTAFNGVCLFCGAIDIDMAHVRACSLEDAKEKIEKNGDDVHALTKIVDVVTMVKTYEAALFAERVLMHTCTYCYAFGFNETIPAVCDRCHGLHTVVSVSAHIAGLLSDHA